MHAEVHRLPLNPRWEDEGAVGVFLQRFSFRDVEDGGVGAVRGLGHYECGCWIYSGPMPIAPDVLGVPFKTGLSKVLPGVLRGRKYSSASEATNAKMPELFPVTQLSEQKIPCGTCSLSLLRTMAMPET